MFHILYMHKYLGQYHLLNYPFIYNLFSNELQCHLTHITSFYVYIYLFLGFLFSFIDQFFISTLIAFSLNCYFLIMGLDIWCLSFFCCFLNNVLDILSSLFLIHFTNNLSNSLKNDVWIFLKITLNLMISSGPINILMLFLSMDPHLFLFYVFLNAFQSSLIFFSSMKVLQSFCWVYS